MNPLIDTSLTDDAVVYIFEYVAQAGDSESDRSPACIDRAIALSHVSKRWRRIALDMVPYIWTLLTSERSHPNLVAAQLERKKGLPLWVMCDALGKRRERSLAMLASISHSNAHIREIDLSFHRRDLTLMLQFLQRPAPRMTSLTLCARDPVSNGQQGPQDPLEMISERELWATLPLHTPSLRYLEIDHVPWFDAGPSPWQLLQTIEVLQPGGFYSTDEDLTLDDVLTRLSFLSQIKSLRLEHAWKGSLPLNNELLNRAHGELGCPPGRVVLGLSNLETLELHSERPGQIVDFCRRISVPSHCDIYIICAAMDNDVSPDRLIKHILPRAVMRVPVHKFTYEDHVDHSSIVFQGTGDGQVVDVEIPCRSFGEEDFWQSAIQTWSLFDFSHLQELTIDINMDPPGDDDDWWDMLFDPCPNVEILTVGVYAISGFINYCTRGAQRQPPCVVYPRLAKLQCRVIVPEEIEELIALARSRFRAGYGPQIYEYDHPSPGTDCPENVVVDLGDFMSGEEEGEEDDAE